MQQLAQGYTLNQRRLTERRIEFEQAVSLLSCTLTNQGQVFNEDEARFQTANQHVNFALP